MNSLKIKFLALTSLILALSLGMTTWHHLRTQEAVLSESARQNARILSDTVRSSVITNMANAQNAEVAHILERIKKEPNIRAVHIFDESGRILMSADRESIGDLIPASELIAFRSGKSSYESRKDGINLHSALVPIHNTPICHGCHDSGKAILGILSLHVAPTETQLLVQKGRQAILLSSLGILIVLLLSMTVFTLYYVVHPIRRLIEAMTHVEKGDFDRPSIQISSSVEMELAAEKFNTMVARLKKLMDTTIRHEREMAIAREQLKHHEAAAAMNHTLEERLKEIEFLNISLEERIEEIEEANFKIADMASDLEVKNSYLDRSVIRLQALNKIGTAINSTMDLEKLFDLLVHKTVETLNARTGFILLLDPENRGLRVGAVYGVEGKIDRREPIPLRPGGVSHWCIENGKALLIRDIEEHPEFSRISRLGFTRETLVCVPLTIKEEIIGTITVANRPDSSSFTNEDLELLSTIAAAAGTAINNARLHEERELTYFNTVQALVSTIEANDSYTRGHSERVTRFSTALARKIGLPPQSIRLLEHAAILHDIGKIGIDSTLLHKSEDLSPTEIDLLRRHPTIGVTILQPIPFLKGVRTIIEQHHERYDGKGYPFGLRGEDLLLESRILAVADAYDAMTSDRPYRRSLPHEAAIREICANAGTQFDPMVTEAFTSLWENGSFQE